MHFRTAQIMHDPVDYESFKRKAAQDAEAAFARQLLEQALPEDFEALRALALILSGENNNLRNELAATKRRVKVLEALRG